ncbi:MAG: hypothetical protein NZ518_12480, partial [Dehalococcoidia bacterium]|nr:hypothetical protein [Dehalococcoidia bacterium]
ATGVLTISAQYGADAATRSNSLPFTVTLNSQMITFPNPGTQNPASFPANLPVTATASSGLPVTLTSQTASVCTVSGFTVTLLSPGLCALVANQGGNTVFAPASPVTQSFAVSLLTQTIPPPQLPTTPTLGQPITLPPTSSRGLPVVYTSLTPSVCTVSGNVVTPVSAGTCRIQATQPGDSRTAPAEPTVIAFEVLGTGVVRFYLPSVTARDRTVTAPPPFYVMRHAPSRR